VEVGGLPKFVTEEVEGYLRRGLPERGCALLVSERCGKTCSCRSAARGVAGANEKDTHLAHVRFGRDFSAPLADLRNVAEGDTCMSCGGLLKAYRGIEARTHLRPWHPLHRQAQGDRRR